MAAPMPEGEVYRLVDEFRGDLLRRERAAAGRIVRAYGEIWKRISREIGDLTRKYYSALDAGEAISPAWTYQLGRLQALRAQVEAEIGRFARYAGDEILAEQAEAALAAQGQAVDLVEASMVDAGLGMAVSRLPVRAVENIAGVVRAGPLREILDELGAEAGQALSDGLVQGLALGQSPGTIVRNIRKALGGNLTRALRIARTEVLRAYREASRQTYAENADLVKGWKWRSARNLRTCAMCWAMDGTEHKLDEALDDHPNGRCFDVPVLKSWEELGFEGIQEQRVTTDTGLEAFERLSEADKFEILGPSKYAAYRDGAIKLGDLVGRRFDPKWGWMRYEKSLKSVLGNKAKDYYPKRSGPQNIKRLSTPAPKGVGTTSATMMVSEAISSIPGGKVGAAVKKGLGAVDEVHSDGELPKLPVKSSRAKSFLGQYSYHWNGAPSAIKVSSHGDHQELTFLHELGHFLDHHGLGKAGRFASKVDGLLGEWRNAVDDSSAIIKLRDMLQSGEMDVRLPDGSSMMASVDQYHAKYLLSYGEIFARSYAQYVATKSGDPVLMNQVAAQLEAGYPYQWADDDFGPIMKALDDLFESLGWL